MEVEGSNMTAVWCSGASADVPSSVEPVKRRRRVAGNIGDYTSLYCMLNYHERLDCGGLCILGDSPHLRRCASANPEAEALISQYRFWCDICNKGFKREQNLQLHRRGHNLPFTLQRSLKDQRKRVYVCPEESCLHHHRSHALGDMTGIRKHYLRKHCEPKWECSNCTKKYAVKTDLKSHMKNCGKRQYKGHCGAILNNRQELTAHNAVCEGSEDDCVEVFPTQPGGSKGIILPYSVAMSQGTTDAKTGEYETEPQKSQYGNPHPAIEATWSQEGLGHLPEPQATRLGCGTTVSAAQDTPQNCVCVLPKQIIEVKSSICERNLASISSDVQPWTMKYLSGKMPSASRLSALFGVLPGGEEATVQSMMGNYLSSAFFLATVNLLKFGLQNANQAKPSTHLSATALLEKAVQMVGNSSSATAFLQNASQMGPTTSSIGGMGMYVSLTPSWIFTDGTENQIQDIGVPIQYSSMHE